MSPNPGMSFCQRLGVTRMQDLHINRTKLKPFWCVILLDTVRNRPGQQSKKLQNHVRVNWVHTTAPCVVYTRWEIRGNKKSLKTTSFTFVSFFLGLIQTLTHTLSRRILAVWPLTHTQTSLSYTLPHKCRL